jgi:hypothetical protein
MDPLTVIGLAGSVVQFVSFSHELVSLGKEIYRSSTGVRMKSVELEIVMKDLSENHASLRHNVSPNLQERTPQEANLVSLVEQCEPIYKELQRVLAGLQVQGNHRKWSAFCKALKSIWKEDQINDMERRLQRLQQQIDSHIIADIRSVTLHNFPIPVSNGRMSPIPYTTPSMVLNASRSQQNLAMVMLTDAKESSRRLEINRVNDLQAVLLAMTKGFKALTHSNRKPVNLGKRAMRPAGNSQRKTALRPAIDTLSDLSQQALKAQAYSVERQIIQELSFEGMRQRRLDIKEALTDTFEWIFSPSDDQPSPSHFSKWLRKGNGTFWISGKPGSGKSTLMKFIMKDPRTMNLLSQWAGTSTLVLANFYFWSPGTPMQKSINGLLRSLTCQILRQCPHLIQASFADRWRNLMEPHKEWEKEFSENLTTDLDQLMNAVERITKANNPDTKFCFFIDGLDEYEGFDRDIAKLIKSLASSDSVKVCLASRPHNVFLSVFGRDPKLMFYIHDFTDRDIRHYIQTVLEENPDFVERKQQEPQNYNQLAEYIRAHANGVFLWVYLVVLQVLDGMENRDRMSDLQKRLERLPTDLRALFTHMLDSVDESYHEQQARMLLIACAATRPLSLSAYSFLDVEVPDFPLRAPVVSLEPDVVIRRLEDMKSQVFARCKLLLEAEERSDDDLEDIYFRWHVTFLHRTVQDYLREGEVQTLLHSRLKTPFTAKSAICIALIAQVQFAPAQCYKAWRESGPVDSLTYQLFEEAKDFEQQHNTHLATYINHFERVVLDKMGPEFRWWDFRVRESEEYNQGDSTSSFLKFAIIYPSLLYLESRLGSSSHAIHPGILADLLDFALPSSTANVSLVGLLLRHGADPNYSFTEEQTPWYNFLERKREWLPQSFHVELIEELILGGADLKNSPKSGINVEEFIRSLSGGHGRLLELIQRRTGQNFEGGEVENDTVAEVENDYDERKESPSNAKKIGILSWFTR